MKRIYLNEAQVKTLMLLETTQKITNELKNERTKKGVIEKIKSFLSKGIKTTVIVAALIVSHNLGYEEAEGLVSKIAHEFVDQYNQRISEPQWELVADDVIATVYNAEPKQCNNDIAHTASMFRLNLDDVLSHRIIAMERTMMAEFGFKYGDVVKIEGPGKWDGIWQIQDTMNKKFAGMHKIDILIPKSEGLGQWKNIKVFRLANPNNAVNVKDGMAPQLTKAQAKEQANRLKLA